MPALQNPTSYARQLAGYMSDPSKIRAYCVREFGPASAPARETIEALIAKRQRSVAAKPPIPVEQPVTDAPAPPPATRPVAAAASLLTDGESVHAFVLRRVCEETGVPLVGLLGRCREPQFVEARSLAVTVLRGIVREDGVPRFSFKQIARMVGRQDHTTVIHLLQRFADYSSRWPQLEVSRQIIAGEVQAKRERDLAAVEHLT